MPPIESFLTNLLEMRSHYQAQVQQCDRLIAQAQDGLIHVDALLVDEALDNQQFGESLLEMRSHYLALVAEQRRAAASAREQLVHINALLAEQMAMQHRYEQTISMQARAYTDNPVLTEGTEGRELPAAADQLEPSPADEEPVLLVEETQAQQRTNEPDQISSPVIPQGDRVEEVTDERLVPLPMLDQQEAPDNNLSKASQTNTPLLPQYEHLTKSEAVEKLLQENIGTILHVNYIVRALYGDLDTQALKVERQRLYETLSKGIARGLWDKIPDQPGCYTIDLKLVDKEEKSPPISHQQADKAENNGTIEVLPPYQHLNFTQGVETVLRENPGQVMTSEKIARILYGELSAKDLSRAKDKIGKILWAGARQKRWQSVAGQLGAYTLSLEKVPYYP